MISNRRLNLEVHTLMKTAVTISECGKIRPIKESRKSKLAKADWSIQNRSNSVTYIEIIVV